MYAVAAPMQTSTARVNAHLNCVPMNSHLQLLSKVLGKLLGAANRQGRYGRIKGSDAPIDNAADPFGNRIRVVELRLLAAD